MTGGNVTDRRKAYAWGAVPCSGPAGNPGRCGRCKAQSGVQPPCELGPRIKDKGSGWSHGEGDATSDPFCDEKTKLHQIRIVKRAHLTVPCPVSLNGSTGS